MLETLRGYIFDGRFIDESLGVLLIALAIVFVLLARNVASERFLLWSGIGSAVVAALLFVMAPSSRILLPPLVVVAMAAVVPLDRFLEQSRATALVASWIVVVLAACQLFVSGAYLALQKPFTLLGSQVSEEEFVAAARPAYAEIVFADANLPRDSRSLVVGLNELYWFSHRVRGGGNFDGPRIARLFDGDAAAVVARLRLDGVTHLVVFENGLQPGGAADADVKRMERDTNLTAGEAATLREVLGGHARVVANDARVGVFELR
jgi:hypothetical protein